MTWSFHVSDHTQQQIESLPLEGQFALLDLIDALEADPFTVVEPYGIADKVMWQATFGSGAGLLVMFINMLTGRITPISFTWAG
ncbi:hypothetical protein [Streptomyces sp. NBC_01465]|uniref:hypothetical protein n=1 Tax=Streptomyces sp. NBC_01465 TaxID=2903878 RepID=UPI002E3510D0|nr:hypothetical protein [Streptomyces sp. NBC_01465]